MIPGHFVCVGIDPSGEMLGTRQNLHPIPQHSPRSDSSIRGGEQKTNSRQKLGAAIPVTQS